MNPQNERLWGWISLVLVVVCLSGCATNNAQPVNKLPPIYISKQDVLTRGTQQQLLAHNCKVDYKAKACEAKKGTNNGK